MESGAVRLPYPAMIIARAARDESESTSGDLRVEVVDVTFAGMTTVIYITSVPAPAYRSGRVT
jgi:hypothetical protein